MCVFFAPNPPAMHKYELAALLWRAKSIDREFLFYDVVITIVVDSASFDERKHTTLLIVIIV